LESRLAYFILWHFGEKDKEEFEEERGREELKGNLGAQVKLLQLWIAS